MRAKEDGKGRREEKKKGQDASLEQFTNSKQKLNKADT